MSWIARGVAAIFDGDKGAVLSVILVVLLIVGVILLVLNLSMKPRGPPAPKWEAVQDDEPQPAPVAPAKAATAKGARRKA